MIKPELLAPAGDLEKLKIAIDYGADAVFIGGREYGLRANASNFSIEEINEGCSYAHKHNAKVYVTSNIFFHNENIPDYIDYIKQLDVAGVDALITAEIYAIKMIKEHTSMEAHLSTQQSVFNSSAALFFKELGVDRIVLARECSKEDVDSIMKKTDIEIEVFIHGSMCIGYSGRCMLSNHMTARDANRGGCSQNCRWEYEIISDSENISKQYGMFSMNPDDLALVDSIEAMCEMNIASLKIEGRMRSIYYIANVVSVYRNLIDRIYEQKSFNIEESFANLLKSANRNISGQYFNSIPDVSGQRFNNRDEIPTKDFCGLVLDYDRENHLLKLEQRNYFKIGDTLEFIRPKLDNVSFVVEEMFNSKMEKLDIARHPQEIVYIKCSVELFENCMARLIK